MQIITTFFNNEPYYMDNFILWYKKTWNATKFIFFIGRNELHEINYNKNNVAFLITEKDNIITYNYKSGTNDRDQWHLLKTLFYEIIWYNHRNYPSLWVDCDEFIYCKDVNNIIENGRFKTHFYEYIPIKPFCFNDNSLWSVWPWYYRRQALNEIPHHDECKHFILNPLQLHEGGHMGNANNYCNTNFTYNDYPNICFHIGVCSKEHFLNSKHWMQTHPIGIEIKNQDRQTGILSEIFDKYYAKCNFNTFNLNLYERYKL